MATKEKRRGFGLGLRTFAGKDGATYIVFQAGTGSYHTFKEVEAKEAARQCGASSEGTTRKMWGELWKQKQV
jgi:hypothetical protein